MRPFRVHMASSPDDALAFLAAEGEKTRVLAGGTDLLVWRREGKVKEEGFLDISGLDELRAVREDATGLRIGALATHSQVLSSSLVQKRAPLLGEACHTVGSLQIRNRGTLGGNLVTASPAGDSIPALFCLEARVLLTSVRGRREVPVEEFFLGPGQTVRQADELVTEILIPATPVPAAPAGGPHHREKHIYLKLGQRNALSISISSVAVRLFTAHDGREVCRRALVAVGAVAPTVVRVRRVEEALVGVPLDEVVPEEVAPLAREEVSPITDIRASAEYRREMVVALLIKALRKLKGG